MTLSQEHITAEIQDKAGEQHIFISGRIWHELYPKADPGLFLKVLRQEIDLSKYGEGITDFYFTFVILEKLTPNFSNWVGSDYYPEKASVDIGIRLPYQEVLAGDKKAVIKLMEKALLAGINTIAEHEEEFIGPFDYKVFKADVETIFENPDWYVEDLANDLNNGGEE
ncbi:hypothetical protein [Phaeodactylibacter sp.]|uniref:hypothetical protein n=1 Tax=Phaeodactylibacter sp. TaxID=1940289 RepID=UPI0025EA59BD|nr:hypothetical protein [Phaeodactylibacter sp.]MCI5091161.1 hypothetical protein [Phaeodactylibacter sp.]